MAAAVSGARTTDAGLLLMCRCRAKYGSSWQKYSDLVPYKMIPYVW